MYNGNRERLDEFLDLYTDRGDENNCWVWKGPVDKRLGYGRTSFIGESMTAHRTAYILAFGYYLKYVNGRRLCVRHLCNNKLCINPKHLALGTYTDNGRDASVAGKGTKMTQDKLRTALKLRKEGFTYREIGKTIGVGAMVASMSIRGKTYYCRKMIEEMSAY